jgi:hypothetical protein
MHPGPSRAPTPWPGLRRHGTTFARPINSAQLLDPCQTCTTSLQKDCRSRQDFLSLTARLAYHHHLVNLDHTIAVHNAADVLGWRDRYRYNWLVMDAQYCYRYSYSRLKAYNAGTCMHERKMGLAETPRRVPAIAAVCRVSLLRVDWYRNRSLPIC